MREILFRGKTVSGEWVYGFYIENETLSGSLVPTIILIDEKGAVRFDGEGYNDEVFVTPETVGQYTGLTDKNGKKVFEHDIVKAYDPLDEISFIVKAYDPLDEISFIGVVKYFDGSFYICNTNSVPYYFGEYCFTDFEVEVIGNIYDNPELMEVEE